MEKKLRCRGKSACRTRDIRWLLTRVRLLDGLGVRADSGTGLVIGMSCDFTPRVKYEPRSTADVVRQSPSPLAD